MCDRIHYHLILNFSLLGFWLLIQISNNLFRCSNLHYSVLVCCIFLELYWFLPHCPICWCVIIYAVPYNPLYFFSIFCNVCLFMLLFEVFFSLLSLTKTYQFYLFRNHLLVSFIFPIVFLLSIFFHSDFTSLDFIYIQKM